MSNFELKGKTGDHSGWWPDFDSNLQQLSNRYGWGALLVHPHLFGSLSLLPKCLKVQKSGGEIGFTLKAYNGRVVTEWLAYCLADAASKPHDDERIPMTYVAMMLSLIKW